MIRGRRSCCGTTPKGDNRSSWLWRISEAGRTVQYPLRTISVNSSLIKSMCSVAERWGPRAMLASLCWVDQTVSDKWADAPAMSNSCRRAAAGCGSCLTCGCMSLCVRSDPKNCSKLWCCRLAKVAFSTNLPKESCSRLGGNATLLLSPGRLGV
jgi:hypothetical protein